jgi:hypothetical protein
VAELSDEIRTFIVQALACFRRPSLIVKDVQSEFGVTLSRFAVQYYHPERNGGKRLAEKWRHLFEATRRAFVEQVPIVHQSYRMALYQRAAEFYEERENFALAAEMAERAAKDMGGFYAARRAPADTVLLPLCPNVFSSPPSAHNVMARAASVTVQVLSGERA